MEINRHNYEAILIDYLDGNLNKKEMSLVEEFLKLNPDINNEFFEIANYVNLNADKYCFPDKNMLKKDPEIFSNTSIENKYIAYIENDLNINDKIEFEKEIESSQEKKQTLNLFKSTIIKPNLNVIFENKYLLKKSIHKNKNKYLYAAMSFAASLLLFLSLWINFIENENSSIISENIDETLIYESISKTPEIQKKYLAENIKTENVKISTSNNTVKSKNISASQIIDSKKEINRESLNTANQLSKDVKIHYTEPITQLNYLEEDVDDNLSLPNNSYAWLHDMIKETEPGEIDYIKKDNVTNEKNQGVFDYIIGGINGIGSLTGTNININRKTNHEGKTSQFAFSAGKFSISRTKK